MPVNPAGLTDAEVTTFVAHMAHVITMQAQTMTDEVNRQNFQNLNQPVCSMTDRLRDFKKTNPLIFRGYKTLENPQQFVDEMHQILFAMGDKDIEKAELASFQLNDVAQSWCKMWKDSLVQGGDPVTWELFKTTFLYKFFPREMTTNKVEEFINLTQGSMTVREYSLKFVNCLGMLLLMYVTVGMRSAGSSQESSKIWRKNVVLRLCMIIWTSPG